MQYLARGSAGHCITHAGRVLVLDGSGDGSGPGTLPVYLKLIIHKVELVTMEIKWFTEKCAWHSFPLRRQGLL